MQVKVVHVVIPVRCLNISACLVKKLKLEAVNHIVVVHDSHVALNGALWVRDADDWLENDPIFVKNEVSFYFAVACA